jgi:hypothetical protein
MPGTQDVVGLLTALYGLLHNVTSQPHARSRLAYSVRLERSGGVYVSVKTRDVSEKCTTWAIPS